MDVRTVPRSRRHPHVSKEALGPALAAAGIAYSHAPDLGGLRRPRPDSRHTAWRNDSFRGYADHMETPAFATALADLVELARTARTCVMCAEAVPWRCHRSLLADALTVRGHTVEHITAEGRASRHALTPFARAHGESLVYDGLV